uniref:Uncharacterized protein LOC111133633 n=1 Tax=Crassostrea virginica TaxID=6565 RepID=A0A8B8ECL6_CRAVI|nr:uncharacterized protein LOC111133633 [Crassostrea virginica]
MLRCGQTNVYVKPECVCSFHNVYDASRYHGSSSCPKGARSDIVTQMKCSDCSKYSLNNNGPCINGGTLTCQGDEMVPEITCQCPPNYNGRFCENKIENFTRICDITSNTLGLPTCDSNLKDCVTFSRNRRYAYICRETHTSWESEGLPLCIDTENAMSSPASKEVSYSTSSNLQITTEITPLPVAVSSSASKEVSYSTSRSQQIAVMTTVQDAISSPVSKAVSYSSSSNLQITEMTTGTTVQGRVLSTHVKWAVNFALIYI